MPTAEPNPASSTCVIDHQQKGFVIDTIRKYLVTKQEVYCINFKIFVIIPAQCMCKVKLKIDHQSYPKNQSSIHLKKDP